MTDNETQEKGRFGLTAAEYADVKTALRMGMAIFIAVGGALVIVALISNALGG